VTGSRFSRWRRRARLAGLTVRRGVDLAATRTRAIAADPERRAELDEGFAIRSAEDAARELGHMKGAVMKLGQMLSFVGDGLPPEAQAALAQLQANAPPMAPALAAGVVRDEFGADPTELFATWDPMPVAAASIGQVHRATMPDGRVVAVKVQYPGVEDAIGADLADGQRIGSLLSAVTLKSVDVAALADELRRRMIDELDYRIEAARQQQFAKRYAGHPFLHVPAVVPDRSGRRVLTSEWADGLTFAEFEASADELSRQRAAEALFRFAQGSIVRDRVFNGDPHPGNYRFAADGRVTLLDFGLVKALDPIEHAGLMSVLDGVLAHDAEATAAAMVTAGFLAIDHGFDAERVFACVSAPYRAYFDETFTFEPGYASDALRSLLDVRGPYADVLAALDMPPSFVLIDRVVWGVSALLGRLGATNRWREIVLGYRHTGMPAVTPLGEIEAGWLASHDQSNPEESKRNL
jgi:predicted unusual protein kinase regulating ubiquinone biosynthesis (AarF/ABC1/UbiB family)